MSPSQHNTKFENFDLGPKGAGMIGVSRGIEYPLHHEILQKVSKI